MDDETALRLDEILPGGFNPREQALLEVVMTTVVAEMTKQEARHRAEIRRLWKRELSWWIAVMVLTAVSLTCNIVGLVAQ